MSRPEENENPRISWSFFWPNKTRTKTYPDKSSRKEKDGDDGNSLHRRAVTPGRYGNQCAIHCHRSADFILFLSDQAEGLIGLDHCQRAPSVGASSILQGLCGFAPAPSGFGPETRGNSMRSFDIRSASKFFLLARAERCWMYRWTYRSTPG